jgi:hypothetical protein
MLAAMAIFMRSSTITILELVAVFFLMMHTDSKRGEEGCKESISAWTVVTQTAAR